MLRSLNKMSQLSRLPCDCRSVVSQSRNYRGRATHNIGRTHGLLQEKKVQTSISKDNVRKSEKFIIEEFNELTANTLYSQQLPTETETPLQTHYGIINFTVSGFDICLVENFAQFLHNTMAKLELDIIENYALPTHDVILKVATTNTADLDKMDTKQVLKNYLRVVQAQNISALQLPVLLQILMSKVPQGVKFEVKEYTEADVRARLQTSLELEKEKQILHDLQSSKK